MDNITTFISAYQEFSSFLTQNRESKDIRILTQLRYLETDVDRLWARLSQEEKDACMRKIAPESNKIMGIFQAHAVKIGKLNPLIFG